MSSAQVVFTVSNVEDSVEVKESFIPGLDGAYQCHTVIANRPIRIHFRMLTPGASFVDYKLEMQATHADGSEVIGMQPGQQPIGTRATRPFEVQDNGRTLITPIYFYTLFSQTQKRPITVHFRLERDGIAMSDWVTTPYFKVVSKPPVALRGPTAKRRKYEEGQAFDEIDAEEHSEAPMDRYGRILKELRDIKAMMRAVKPDPEAFNAGDSRPLKRKVDVMTESEIAATIGGMTHESIRHMLRELSTSHPETFNSLLLLGTAMQQMDFNCDDDHFPLWNIRNLFHL